MKVHITTNLLSLIPFPQPAISILPHWRALSTEHHHPTVPQQQVVHGYARVHVPFSLPSHHFSTSQPSPVFLDRGTTAKLAQPSFLLCRKVETKGQTKSPVYSSISCLFNNIWILGIVSSLKWLSDMGIRCQEKWFTLGNVQKECRCGPWKCHLVVNMVVPG